MPHRILGRTGESVSLLGLGGAHVADHGDMEEKAAIALMHAAIDEGINFFDNAWGYSNGASEIRMGKALRGGYRDRVFLMTKDASRHPKRAIAHLEESLRRLQTDVIDLWQFHSIREPDDLERIYEQGLLEAVLKAKEEGKIRYIGFTGHTLPSLHVEMIERGFAWDATQMPINVFDPHYLSFVEQVLPLAVEKNIGVIAMKTLGGYARSDPRNRCGDSDRVSALRHEPAGGYGVFRDGFAGKVAAECGHCPPVRALGRRRATRAFVAHGRARNAGHTRVVQGSPALTPCAISSFSSFLQYRCGGKTLTSRRPNPLALPI